MEVNNTSSPCRTPLLLHSHFSLTLMVNHACNLQCSYCYTGAKTNRPMPLEVGFAAIDCALASLTVGGTLELGFFGGEPLFESTRIARWITYAEAAAAAQSARLKLSLTTNGTQTGPAAWELMLRPDLELAVSCDGTPATHDRHRRFAGGSGSATLVEATLRRLVTAGKDFRVVMVVRPDTLSDLPQGIQYLQELGVPAVDLSLDLWTTWTEADVRCLESVIPLCAALWRSWLPHFGINWFDGKLAHLAQLPVAESSARCGFGAGEIAVAPSGRLYPCERLIGEDLPDNPSRLAGHALQETDFLLPAAPGRSAEACTICPIQASCNTSCRCSNYVRTGDVGRPDGLLCRLDKACFRATRAVLQSCAQSPTLLTSTQPGDAHAQR
jgi:uncharacterized protein